MTLADADHAMVEIVFSKFPPDKGGRRFGIERRHFQYTCHVPERRSGHDRRTGLDRRSPCEPRSVNPGGERRTAFASPPDLRA
jgi:hypothetical protein